MDKISFKDFMRIMLYDITKNQTCVEIEFCVDNHIDYQASWLGKMMDKDTKKTVYWFGLTEDGIQAYNFDSFEQFRNTKVFYGNSIEEIWKSISIISIDACETQERLSFYLGN